MNICLDNIKLSEQKAGGVSNYWCELISRLLNSENNVKIIEQKKSLSTNIFRSKFTVPPNKISYEMNIPLMMLRYLPVLQVFHPDTVLHSGYYRVSNQKDVTKIITVYDFVYEYFRRGLPRIVHTLQKGHAICNADGIICISHNTKKDLLKFYPHIDESIIKVIHLGVSDDFFPITTAVNDNKSLSGIIDKEYVLYVGERKGYKNFILVVDVMSALPEYKLVIVGGPALTMQEIQLLNV